MTWLLFSLLSAGSEALKDTFGKLSSQKTDEYVASFSMHFFSTLLALPLLFYFGMPELKQSFWVGSAAFLVLTPLWSILYMKALRLSQISKVIPLMAFNPLMTGLLAYFFTETAPKLFGWIGIFAICAGIYVANMDIKTLRNNFWSPIKNIFKDPGALAMLGVAAIWSLAAHFAKMRVDGSSAIVSTLSGGMIGMLTTFLVASFLKKPIKLNQIYNARKSLAPVGIFYFLATILSGIALGVGSATYVFAVKRSSIAGSLLTGKYIFKESIDLVKILGTALICVGVVLIAVS